MFLYISYTSMCFSQNLILRKNSFTLWTSVEDIPGNMCKDLTPLIKIFIL